ncbi:MAG: nicotinamide riboside transporter PnuC [Muribaculaceae bacterium]|nr:nicotinamide riboside transporter PnuC [Muribaculaceae bacterium]MDE6229023.1 nicotinamide riboside transporter PnuC [Muribaculaceae bacterium]
MKKVEIFGFIIGLLYLYWEYKADAKMWIASIVMPCISMWIYFQKGIYADFAINIYYILIAFYGYWNWTKRRGPENNTLKVSRIPLRVLGLCLGAVCLLWVAIAQILIHFTDSTIPWIDAFTTAMSIVGLWMGARKYCEQWLVWFIVDIVTVPMQLYKGLIFYPLLYTAYTIIALFGYRKWLRLAAE